MAETDLEKLVLRIEANTTQFNKALKKIEKNTASSMGRSEKSVLKFTSRLGGLGKAAKGAVSAVGGLAGIAVGGGLAGIGATIKSTTSQIVDLASEAKRAGVSFEAFQELDYAAGKNKVSIDALTDGLKEMQLRADEFISTGAGSGAEAFQRLGYDAKELKQRLKEPDKLFEDIIGRLQQLDRAAQIRVSDEIFGGTGGEQFVQMLGDGVEGLRKARKEARDLGLVMNDELVDKAKEIDRQFQTITTRIGTGLKSAVVEVASELSNLIGRFLELENAMPDPSSQARGATAARRARRGSVPGRTFDEIFGSDDETNYASGAAGRRQRRNAQRASIQTTPAISTSSDPVETIPSTGFKVPGSGGGSGAGGNADQQADKVQEVILALEQQAQQLGRTSDEQELYNALAKAGVSLQSEEGQAIAAAVNGLQAKRVAMQEAISTSRAMQLETEELAQNFEYLGQAGVDTLLDIVSGASSAEDAMRSFALQIANAAAQAALFGSGPMASFMSALTGTSGGALTGLFTSLAGSLVSSGTATTSLSPGFLFDTGGYTGNLAADEVAGVVHGGEYVFSKRATDKIGAGNLEALHKRLKGYSNGGYVDSLFSTNLGGMLNPVGAQGGSGGQSSAGGNTHNWYISTPDAQSFKQSKGQIAANMARLVAQGGRNQ
ncbi:hypothetical protein [Cohaesibacter marisflavi]|uniref:hypothetical protein n=1 Tax=Cohaesibacter marisflavi TaxID=655353 RepID=UPI0029C79EC8|nr:hypothetical protein [Cohaesibacter marisflavi]